MTLVDGDSSLTARHLIGTRITTGYAQTFAGATLIDSTANRTGSFRLFGVVYNGVSSSIRVNGAVGASGDAGSQSLGAVYIGRNNAGQPLIGDMSEVMVFTTAPTAGEITAIESYLNAKWAVY